jgi:hypothetical protein
VSEETLMLRSEQERLWREDRYADKTEARQRQGRDKAETMSKQGRGSKAVIKAEARQRQSNDKAGIKHSHDRAKAG